VAPVVITNIQLAAGTVTIVFQAGVGDTAADFNIAVGPDRPWPSGHLC